VNGDADFPDDALHAGGQTAVAPHDQLYRYAEDLRRMIGRYGELDLRYRELVESGADLLPERGTLDELKRMSYLARHDLLTGLPNRLLFEDRIRQVIFQARRSDARFTVIFIDLDDFKPVNDKHGHAVGDRVLQQVATRMADALRETDSVVRFHGDEDTVARLGGDEFIILAPGLSGDEDIGRVCGKVIGALARPMDIDGRRLSIGASLGCAEYPRHGADEEALLMNADAAMYLAKATGGNMYAIYGGNPEKEK
jgi:GGDEF domain-containing protein